MQKIYPASAQPCVDASLREVCNYMFRGSVYGQSGEYQGLTEEDRGNAASFDVEAALRKALQRKAQQQTGA